jgi:hypothetical protein
MELDCVEANDGQPFVKDFPRGQEAGWHLFLGEAAVCLAFAGRDFCPMT